MKYKSVKEVIIISLNGKISEKDWEEFILDLRVSHRQPAFQFLTSLLQDTSDIRASSQCHMTF